MNTTVVKFNLEAGFYIIGHLVTENPVTNAVLEVYMRKITGKQTQELPVGNIPEQKIPHQILIHDFMHFNPAGIKIGHGSAYSAECDQVLTCEIIPHTHA